MLCGGLQLRQRCVGQRIVRKCVTHDWSGDQATAYIRTAHTLERCMSASVGVRTLLLPGALLLTVCLPARLMERLHCVGSHEHSQRIRPSYSVWPAAFLQGSSGCISGSCAPRCGNIPGVLIVSRTAISFDRNVNSRGMSSRTAWCSGVPSRYACDGNGMEMSQGNRRSPNRR